MWKTIISYLGYSPKRVSPYNRDRENALCKAEARAMYDLYSRYMRGESFTYSTDFYYWYSTKSHIMHAVQPVDYTVAKVSDEKHTKMRQLLQAAFTIITDKYSMVICSTPSVDSVVSRFLALYYAQTPTAAAHIIGYAVYCTYRAKSPCAGNIRVDNVYNVVSALLCNRSYKKVSDYIKCVDLSRHGTVHATQFVCSIINVMYTRKLRVKNNSMKIIRNNFVDALPLMNMNYVLLEDTAMIEWLYFMINHTPSANLVETLVMIPNLQLRPVHIWYIYYKHGADKIGNLIDKHCVLDVSGAIDALLDDHPDFAFINEQYTKLTRHLTVADIAFTNHNAIAKLLCGDNSPLQNPLHIGLLANFPGYDEILNAVCAIKYPSLTIIPYQIIDVMLLRGDASIDDVVTFVEQELASYVMGGIDYVGDMSYYGQDSPYKYRKLF